MIELHYVGGSFIICFLHCPWIEMKYRSNKFFCRKKDIFLYSKIDFSYQIKVATTLDKFKNILYNTFHPAGSELFGEFLSITNIPYDIESLLYNSTGPEISVIEDELLDILVLEDGSTELIQENTF